jgi:hypothetical protein
MTRFSTEAEENQKECPRCKSTLQGLLFYESPRFRDTKPIKTYRSCDCGYVYLHIAKSGTLMERLQDKTFCAWYIETKDKEVLSTARALALIEREVIERR